MPARLVVLASGGGSTLQAVLDDAELRPTVVAVGSDRPAAQALARATAAGVETFTVPLEGHADRAAWNRALEAELAAREPDLLVLAGFMRILDGGLVRRFPTVNTHPALLPSFPGAHAIRDALAAGVTGTGVSVHWVDEGVDTGPLIAQQAVAIEPDDDEDTLRARVQAVEKPLFVQTLKQLTKEYQ